MVKTVRNTKYPEHMHITETRMAELFKTKLNIGIIGVGGLGSAVAHYFIATLPYVRVHLTGRDKQTDSIEARVKALQEMEGKV
mgnify:CR=1 FL=1